MGVTNTANNFEIALTFRNAPGKLRLITLQALQVRLKRIDLNSQDRERRIAAAVKQWHGGKRPRATRLELQRDLEALLESVRNAPGIPPQQP